MKETVRVGGKTIVLVGTAHVSKKSVELVKETIQREKPDAVGVELCKQRLEQLRHEKKWKETDVLKIIKTGRVYLFLINLLLSNMQRKFGKAVGIKPGSEMLAAVQAAEKKHIPVVLLDRDIKVTMKRAFALMGILEKLKFFTSLFFGFFSKESERITSREIEELKKKDMMTKLMEELSKEVPNMKKVLVDERDEFIAQQILGSKAKKIVAVVGIGHIEGIKRHLDEKRNTRHLLEIPKKRSIFKVLSYLLPLLIIAIFAYGFYAKGIAAVLGLLGFWFLINGSLAALGVLIARGRLLSAAVAFLAAPFTALHPALAVGWFAGLAEAKLNTPKVKDFEELSRLNSYRDFERNRVTRILLVTAYANIGSTIGTIIAIPYILTLLA